MTESSPVRVFVADKFKIQMRVLKKHYRQIRSEIKVDAMTFPTPGMVIANC